MAFSITSRLNKQDYAKAMLIGLYKKTYYIFVTIFGLCLLTVSVLNYLNALDFEVDSPLTEVILGLILLFLPLITVLLATGRLKSNSSLLNDMNFTFTEAGVVIVGTTFKTEYVWDHIIKQKEIGRFLILYHTKRVGNFIDKSKLTAEQLFFIKSKISKK